MILLKEDKTIISILLSVVAFTMPLGLIHNINPISIIVLTVFTAFLIIKKRNTAFKTKELQILPLLYFFFLVFTLIYSENLSESAKQLEKNLSFLIFPLVFYKLKEYLNQKTKKKIIFSFVLGNIIALFACLIRAVYLFYSESYTDPLLKGSFYFSDFLELHPTYFSMYLIICIVFIRNYVKENKTNLLWSVKLILLISTIFIWVSILHLRSRSAVLALILVEIVLLASIFLNRYPKVNRKIFWLFFASFAAFIMFLAINGKVYDYGKEYFKRDTNAAIDDRLKNWDASLDAIYEAPFLGNGLYDGGTVRDKYFYINGYDVGVDNKYNSHNQFIETTLVGGFFGLALLLLMLFKLLDHYRKTHEVLVLCFFTTLVAVMMTESILVRQHGIVFFSFFYVFFNTRLNEK